MKHLFLLGILSFFYAFSFGPMTQTISLDKDQKTTQFQLENSSNDTIPIVVTVQERIQKPDGTEDLPETDEVRVYPPQLLLKPKEKRTIRVDWIGKTKPILEKSFRITAEQVPVEEGDQSKSSSGIKMLLRYMNALYVDPGNTKSDLRIEKIESSKKLSITIQNHGSAHQYLTKPKITIKSGKKKFQIPESEMKLLDGQNVLAKSSRVFHFEKLPELSGKPEGVIEIGD